MFIGVASVTVLGGCGEAVERVAPDPTTFSRATVDTGPSREGSVGQVQEDGARNRAPDVKGLVVVPATPTTTDTLRVEYRAVDKDGEAVRVRYRWLVNDEVASEDVELPAEAHDKGDVVQVEVLALDSLGSTVAVSDPIVIANSPPRLIAPPGGLSSRLDGARFRAHDPDGDEVTFRVEDPPPGLTIDGQGVLHYTPPAPGAATSGVFATRVVVEDEDGAWSAFEGNIAFEGGRREERVLRQGAGEAATPGN